MHSAICGIVNFGRGEKVASHVEELSIAQFVQYGAEPPFLEFAYENWKGITYAYVVEPEKIEFGPYDGTGANNGQIMNWVLHAEVVTRSGDPRPDMQTRRRTFLLTKIRHLREVPRG